MKDLVRRYQANLIGMALEELVDAKVNEDLETENEIKDYLNLLRKAETVDELTQALSSAQKLDADEVLSDLVNFIDSIDSTDPEAKHDIRYWH